jgi:hypothetical protein
VLDATALMKLRPCIFAMLGAQVFVNATIDDNVVDKICWREKIPQAL